jgi:hypothetical protein
MLARILFFVVGSPLLAFGIYSLYWDLTDPSKWPSVEGTVLESKVNSYSSRHPGTRRYRLTVRYEYEAGGARQVGNRANVSGRDVAYGFDPESVERIQQSSFPTGGKVLVYFDPKNPKRAVLNTRPTNGIEKGADVFIVCLGGLAVCAALFGKAPRISRSN